MATGVDDLLEGSDADAPEVVELPALEGEESRYLNRELSWLDFNARVLALAEDADVPVLERAKFLAIFSQNLDEFFQVRVAGLKDQLAAGLGATAPDGLSPLDQLRAARERVEDLTRRLQSCFVDDIAPALGRAGIVLSDWEQLDDDDRDYLVEVFEERIFPVLTPLAVDPGHPFPYISNLSLNLAVLVHDPVTGAQRFARVKVPPLLPRFVVMADGERFVPLEQVIAAHLVALPRHGDRVAVPVPRHAQRRHVARGGGGRRSARWRSSTSCAGDASVARCGSRSTRPCRRKRATCSCASSTSAPATCTSSRARSISAGSGACTSSTGPS